MQATPVNATLSPSVGTRQFTPFRSEVNPRELALAGIQRIQTLCSADVAPSISHDRRHAWTLDMGEALCMLEEASNLCLIHYSQDAQRPGAEESYKRFAEEIEPQIARIKECARASMRTMWSEEEIPEYLRTYFAQSEALSSLFREENLPIIADQDGIQISYQTLAAAIRANYDGNEYRLDQLADRFECASRDEREKLWSAVWQTRYAHRDAHHDVISQLIPLRIEMRDNALPQGKVSEYFYRNLSSEFTQGEIDSFAEAIRNEIKPLTFRIYEKLREGLGVTALKPWDVSCTRYFEGLPRTSQKTAFSSTEHLVGDVVQILESLSPDLAAIFLRHKDSGAIDIEARDGKVTDQYAGALPFSRGAFLQTLTKTGTESAQTLIHELGHFTHFTLSSSHEFGPNRHGNLSMECAELASLGLELLCAAELLASPCWASSPLHLNLALEIIESNILFLPYAVHLTQFQNWLYQYPGHTNTEREHQWAQLDEQYGPPIDWSSHAHIRGMQWQQQAHVFIHPFYYPQYAIATCGAIDLFNQYVKAGSAEGKREIVARFLGALSLGSSVSGREVFARAGASFMPEAAVLRESVSTLMGYIQQGEPLKASLGSTGKR